MTTCLTRGISRTTGTPASALPGLPSSGTNASSSFRFTRIGEQLGSGSQTFFDENVNFVGLQGNQLDLFQSNSHPGYRTGLGGIGTNTRVRTYLFDNTFSYFLRAKAGAITSNSGLATARTRSRHGFGAIRARSTSRPIIPTTRPIPPLSRRVRHRDHPARAARP